MGRGLFNFLLITFAAVVGYIFASRVIEESRDFR